MKMYIFTYHYCLVFVVFCLTPFIFNIVYRWSATSNAIWKHCKASCGCVSSVNTAIAIFFYLLLGFGPAPRQILTVFRFRRNLGMPNEAAEREKNR